jgi:hypothetical protein
MEDAGMALDTTAPKTRRVILAGACGGAAALAVSALARPAAVLAADGDNAILGEANQEATSTGFETASPGETGVRGISSATTDQGSGVYGEASSPEAGTGVFGRASATTGNSTGVYGEASSPEGRGVVGSATSPDGGTGVSGDAEGAGGVGVFGSAAATSGDGVGVFGISNAAEGAAVRAAANSTTGSNYGLWAECSSPDGIAVYGQNQATTGGGSAIGGWSDSPDGTGVGGTGGKYGVTGDSSGTGVFGHSGELTGVLGFAGMIDMGVPPPDPVAKTGVFGYSNIDAASVGVLGKATTGTGVRAVATTGTALYATTASAKSGTALRTVGRVRFDNSVGIATISSGRASVVVTPGIDLSASSAVVATLQANPSGTIAVQGVVVNATANTFTIYLTTSASSNLKVAWHVFG